MCCIMSLTADNMKNILLNADTDKITEQMSDLIDVVLALPQRDQKYLCEFTSYLIYFPIVSESITNLIVRFVFQIC